jgi:hypothetical protein
MLAIRSARLFDGVADQLRPRPLVLVDQGRIVDVDVTGADPPEGAELVELGEAALLPGLIDSHTHLVLDASNDPVGHLADIDDDQLLEQCRARAWAALAAGVPAERWVTASAGQGAKGSRLYDWARVDLAAPAGVGAARWLLVRRRRAATGGWPSMHASARLAPRCSGWSGWPGAAGRWRRASSRPRAVGLDHYEVRRWPGWYRHITLALLAHAFLVVTRAQATSDPATRGDAAA